MINLSKITEKDISQLFFFVKGFIGPVKIDSFLSEDHRSNSIITEHPVESGSSIVDNIQIRPAELTIVGAVMNFESCLSKNSTISQIGETYFKIKSIYDKATNINQQSFSNLIASFVGGRFGDRSVSAFAKLIELQEQSAIFNIQTSLKYYRNMTIESLDSFRDKYNPNTLIFTARMKQIRLTQIQSVSIDSSKYEPGSIRDQSSSAVSRGSISGARPTLGTGGSSVNSGNSTSLPGVGSFQDALKQYGLDDLKKATEKFRGANGDSVITRTIRGLST